MVTIHIHVSSKKKQKNNVCEKNRIDLDLKQKRGSGEEKQQHQNWDEEELKHQENAQETKKERIWHRKGGRENGTSGSKKFAPTIFHGRSTRRRKCAAESSRPSSKSRPKSLK